MYWKVLSPWVRSGTKEKFTAKGLSVKSRICFSASSKADSSG